MPTDEQVQKYIKVKALADRGAEGERASASRILAKMRQDYPGIAQAAAAWEAKQSKDNEPEPPPEEQEIPLEWSDDDLESSSRWSNIFNFARAAMNNAYDFASHVANAYVGRQLAEENIECHTKSTKAGKIVITLKVPVTVYTYAVQSLNDVQKQAFRQVMHELLEDQIIELMGEEEA